MIVKFICTICIVLCSNLSIVAQTLKVVSFNIRYENNKDGINGWNNRKKDLAQFLTDCQLDIICMQEVVSSQLSFVKQSFPRHKCIGVGREDGKTKGEFTVDSSKFEILDSGHFWLSDTLNKPGALGWDAKIPRIVTWARVKHVISNKSIVVINTHLDNLGVMARRKSVDMILDWCNYYIKREPVIISGDFNDSPSSDAYKMMVKKNNHFVDTFVKAKERSGVQYSYHRFGQLTDSLRKRIDYVFVNKKFKILKIEIPKESCINGYYLSDHNPVIVWLKL